MKKIGVALAMFMLTGSVGEAQMAMNRAQFSIMVVPYTSKGEDVLTRIEKDAGYKEAIAAIHTALLNLGYKNLLDFKTHIEVVKQRRIQTSTTASSELMKIYIEDAPVDIVIEAEIIWDDPKDQPRARQARILLKAIDKYNGAIYSNNTSIQSYQREFADLAQAVKHALTKDGAAQFNDFLRQLDASYAMLVKEGRQMFIKFEVGMGSNFFLTQRVGDERLSDKIGHCIQQHAYNGQYKQIGEGKAFIDYLVQVPVVDSSGRSITPSNYLRRKVDQNFFKLGFDVDYSVVGAWINFTLLKKNDASALRD